MTQGLGELVEQFCLYQLKQRGRTKGGVEATRWVLNRFVKFVRAQTGRTGTGDGSDGGHDSTVDG